MNLKGTKNNYVLIFLAAVVVIFIVLKWQGKKDNGGDLSAPLKRGNLIESVYGIGTVTANKTFQFKPGVINTIHNLMVEEGDQVEQGRPLMELDGGFILKAPFAGTVTSLPFKVGENIFPEAVGMELVDLLDRYLVVSLEQRGALRVARGQKAKLSFDGMREHTFEGIVDSVYSSGNNFLIRINIAQLPPQILPGMTADTAIGIQERNNVLLVPVAALRDGKVLVHGVGMNREVGVTTGVIDGAMAEVTSVNLKEGDRLYLPTKMKK